MRRFSLRRFAAVAAASVAIFLSSCSSGPLKHADWAPDVRSALNDFIRTYGNGPQKEYVVFDFDNTTAIFDISEQLMIYQLETMSFGLTPQEFVEAVVEPEADAPQPVREKVAELAADYEALYERFGPFTPAGLSEDAMQGVRESDLWKSFAIEMDHMYDFLQDFMTADEAYLWVLGWFSGMTEEELYDLARRSHTEYSRVETRRRSWTLGERTHSWIDGVAVTDNLRELWKALNDNGIDVWVCSASPVMPVLAAVDAFGLHDMCRGVVAMTMSIDSTGRFGSTYDYETGYGFHAIPGGGWERGTLPTRTQTMSQGKVTSIVNSIAPEYSGRGPLAGFMDSTGDFCFCTEFSSLKLALCFNRADRKVTDGGALIAETAVYERDVLGYDLKKAAAAGDVLYLLQGRDENGLRSLRPSNLTIRFGETVQKLFRGAENEAQLEYFKQNNLTVKEILERFCIETEAEDASNPLGFKYGFLSDYPGYRSL